MELEEKPRDNQSDYYLSPGGLEYLWQISWDSVHYSWRYFSLDRSGGPTDITTQIDTDASWSWFVYVLPPSVNLHEQHKRGMPLSALMVGEKFGYSYGICNSII